MFTGIVQNLGQIKKIQHHGALLTLSIQSRLPSKDLKRGTSVLVDGVCLTVEKNNSKTKTFIVTLVSETLKKTFFSKSILGQKVNLEASLRVGDPIAGHFVLGHVDFLGKIIQEAPELRVQLPLDSLKFFPAKGSVTINGVSLTIAAQRKNHIEVALIPETLKKTNLKLLRKSDPVHIEIDALARYICALQSS